MKECAEEWRLTASKRSQQTEVFGSASQFIGWGTWNLIYNSLTS
jgi:hypothetical protein